MVALIQLKPHTNRVERVKHFSSSKERRGPLFLSKSARRNQRFAALPVLRIFNLHPSLPQDNTHIKSTATTTTLLNYYIFNTTTIIMSVVGLDLGLQNSVIAAAGRGGVDVILNGNSNRLNP